MNPAQNQDRQNLETCESDSLAPGSRRAYPFGPQTGLSSLLVHREHLLEEINSQKRCLERLKKDMADCNAMASSTCERSTTNKAARGIAPQFAIDVTMEQFLLPWLTQLEKRLETVSRDIEILATQSRLETQPAEESVFELLRAAG